jgi:hypothetical protein
MRIASWFIAAVVAGAALAAPAHADDKVTTKFDAKITASGPVKAFKGPEGAIVVMLEVNGGKEMLVHFKKVGGELDGKTLRRLYEDLGDGKKNLYLDHKRGSKPYRTYLASARDGHWEVYIPGSKDSISIWYAEALSDQFKPEDLIKAVVADK